MQRGDARHADGARTGLAWLAHPVTLVALATLLVNDHLLKAAWPGIVTGKLSDVAGLVLAPPLLATLVLLVAPRAPTRAVAVLAMAAVGTAFAIVKTVPGAAAVASSAWSVLNGPSVVRPDVTDLLALPSLALAWLAFTRARDRPAPGQVTRALRLAVVLPVALAGVAATSAPYVRVEVATGVGPGVGGDTVILVGRDAVTATSHDGLTWQKPDPETAPSSAGQQPCPVPSARCPNYDPTATVVARMPRSMACARDACYRVVAGALRIEESSDGGTIWTTAWSVSDLQRARYATVLSSRARWDQRYTGNVRADLSCRTVYAVPTSGVVVAACGLVGFVRRDAAGHWAMIGFTGDHSETPDLAETSAGDSSNALMIVLFGWFILLVAAEVHARVHRPGQSAARLSLAAFVSLACLPLMALRWDSGAGPDPLIGGWTCTPFLFGGMLAWFVTYVVDNRGFPWRLLPLAVAAPVLGSSLQHDYLHGRVYWTLAWAGIWIIAIGALTANLALAIWFPPRRVDEEVPAASTSGHQTGSIGS
jgi:hypothetical protein